MKGANYTSFVFLQISRKMSLTAAVANSHDSIDNVMEFLHFMPNWIMIGAYMPLIQLRRVLYDESRRWKNFEILVVFEDGGNINRIFFVIILHEFGPPFLEELGGGQARTWLFSLLAAPGLLDCPWGMSKTMTAMDSSIESWSDLTPRILGMT